MHVNCWVVPFAMVGAEGVTAMETRVAEVTMRLAEPDTASDSALMVVIPREAPATNTLVAVTVATEVSDEVQMAVVVMSREVPSE
ncbi:MAG: hypothetical protein A2X56_15425 [Nitrospirae bacterium GWC2_57_13]|nr:MAG: hypothetical protein A2X56_15425 [Nitrospirae bacterium GWC2_57_13]OGW41461.1 MAG: hypothetical protein A2X57_11640 [Nitrospirae bacterium GWD2_57_8]